MIDLTRQTFGSLATATLGFITFAGAIGSIAIYGANLKNDFESAKARVIQLEAQVTGLREQLAAQSPVAPPGPPGPQGPAGPRGEPGPAADAARLDRLEAQLARLTAAYDASRGGEAAAQAGTLALISGKGMRGTARDATGASWPFTVRSVVAGDAGSFSAEIVWPTLASVNRIEGTAGIARIRFVETGYVSQGKAPLGCTYALDVTAADTLSGTFRGCSGSPDVVGQVDARIER